MARAVALAPIATAPAVIIKRGDPYSAEAHPEQRRLRGGEMIREAASRIDKAIGAPRQRRAEGAPAGPPPAAQEPGWRQIPGDDRADAVLS